MDALSKEAIRWTDDESSGDGLTMRAARVGDCVEMYVHRDAKRPGQGWRYDVEIGAHIEPAVDYADELAARRQAIKDALTWAEELAATLREKVGE